MRSYLLILSLGVALVQPLNSFAVSKRELLERLEKQERVPVQPTRTARELDPCVELSLAESEYFRAAGTAVAADESKAKSAAAVDARNQLASMIRVVVEGASKDYTINSNGGRSTETELIGEEIMSQYVYQSIELTKPIQWSIYDLSDGSVKAYVCLEMLKRPDEIEIEMRERAEPEQQPVVTPVATPVATSVATPVVTPIVTPIATPTTPPSKSKKGLIVAQNPEAEDLYEQGRKECVAFKYSTGLLKVMEAVEMGSVNAQHYMGMIYLYGDNVEQDSKLAFQYLLSAANNGNEEAIFQVAEMYESGTGVTKDKAEAKYWYQRAVDLGNEVAERRLWRL